MESIRFHCIYGQSRWSEIRRRILYRILLYNSESTRETFVQNVVREWGPTLFRAIVSYSALQLGEFPRQSFFSARLQQSLKGQFGRHCKMEFTRFYRIFGWTGWFKKICRRISYNILLYNSEPTRETFVQSVIRESGPTLFRAIVSYSELQHTIAGGASSTVFFLSKTSSTTVLDLDRFHPLCRKCGVFCVDFSA